MTNSSGPRNLWHLLMANKRYWLGPLLIALVLFIAIRVMTGFSGEGTSFYSRF